MPQFSLCKPEQRALTRLFSKAGGRGVTVARCHLVVVVQSYSHRRGNNQHTQRRLQPHLSSITAFNPSTPHTSERSRNGFCAGLLLVWGSASGCLLPPLAFVTVAAAGSGSSAGPGVKSLVCGRQREKQGKPTPSCAAPLRRGASGARAPRLHAPSLICDDVRSSCAPGAFPRLSSRRDLTPRRHKGDGGGEI